jgi:hypothetical protein
MKFLWKGLNIFWLLVVGCWLLVVGCWLLVIGTFKISSLAVIIVLSLSAF